MHAGDDTDRYMMTDVPLALLYLSRAHNTAHESPHVGVSTGVCWFGCGALRKTQKILNTTALPHAMPRATSGGPRGTTVRHVYVYGVYVASTCTAKGT